MPLRGLLAGSRETVQDLVLAADDRYWDAYELAVQGRFFAAIYVAGYVAEMLLKTAGFRFDGARPGDPVQPRLGPARTYGAARFPAIRHEGYHSLRFWAAFLEHKRADAGRPLDATLQADLQRCAERAYGIWWISMRYRSARVPSAVPLTAEAQVLPLLDAVDWLKGNHSALWS